MRYKLLLALIVLNIYAARCQNKNEKLFFAPPYLQIGSEPSAQSLELLWQSTDETASWTVEHKTDLIDSWIKTESVTAGKSSLISLYQLFILLQLLI